jgi:hypothetical protein
MIEQWNAGAARPPEIGFVWRICPSRERRSPDRHRGQGLGSFVQPAPGPAARLGLFGTIGPLGPPADHRIGFVWRDRPASVARLAGHRLGAPLRAIGFVWRVSLLGTRGRLPGLALFGRIGLRAPPGLPQIGFVWHSRSLSARMQRQIGFVWHNRPPGWDGARNWLCSYDWPAAPISRHGGQIGFVWRNLPSRERRSPDRHDGRNWVRLYNTPRPPGLARPPEIGFV